MAGYSKTPLAEKMGIKQGMRGIFVRLPKEVQKLFERAPFDVTKKLSGDFDYIHLFVRDEKKLKIDFFKVKKFLKLDGILCHSGHEGLR